MKERTSEPSRALPQNKARSAWSGAWVGQVKNLDDPQGLRKHRGVSMRPPLLGPRLSEKLA